MANCREATELYLEEFPVKRLDRTILTTFEAAGPAALGKGPAHPTKPAQALKYQ